MMGHMKSFGELKSAKCIQKALFAFICPLVSTNVLLVHLCDTCIACDVYVVAKAPDWGKSHRRVPTEGRVTKASEHHIITICSYYLSLVMLKANS